jgi:hypothetical protein
MNVVPFRGLGRRTCNSAYSIFGKKRSFSRHLEKRRNMYCGVRRKKSTKAERRNIDLHIGSLLAQTGKTCDDSDT